MTICAVRPWPPPRWRPPASWPVSRADDGLWAFDNPPTALVQQRYGFEQPAEPAGRAVEARRRNLAAVAELAAGFLVDATARPSP